jgi:hypothetical protein
LTDPEIDFFVSSDSHETEFLGRAFVSSYPQMAYRVAVADKRFDIVDNPQDENQLYRQALSKKIKQRKIAEIVINCPEK